MPLTKKITYIIFAILCIAIGLYPLVYFIIDRSFGLLSTKSSLLLNNDLWNLGFYAHIVFGGLALLLGWSQFSSSLRRKNIKLHRDIGKVYMICVFISGISAVYIANFATGGIISTIGFTLLGIFWMITTLLAFLEIKNGYVTKHQNYMTYSYAACFGAVTLRIWLPILSSVFEDFITTYRIVSWLCWVPNVIVAYFLVQKNPRRKRFVTSES